jgi:tetratricopeptide (TPR) repeat protein
VLVLVGDHGEGLGSHGEISHGYFIYDYAVRVPLIVVAPLPGLQGKRVPSQVGTVDVFPTVLQLAGVSGVPETQGRSLVPLIRKPGSGREVPAYAESMAPSIQFGWSPLRVLRTTGYKYIDSPKAELFDVSRDPGETSNLLGDHPDVVRGMKSELEKIIAMTERGAPTPQAANLDKDTLERLSALGYVGTPVAARKPSGADAPLADPKDKFFVFQKVTTAGELVTAEKYDEAMPLLESALAEEPGIPQALLVLATCYKETGRMGEAKSTLDLLLKADPENVQGLISLANILIDEGNNEDVVALCKQVRRSTRRTLRPLLVGRSMGALDFGQALPYIERAVELQPKVDRSRFNLAACLIGLGQLDRAEPVLREVIAASPKWPLAHFNLGLLYEEQGRLEEARQAYVFEVKTYPSEFKARFNLRFVRSATGPGRGADARDRQDHACWLKGIFPGLRLLTRTSSRKSRRGRPGLALDA